MPRGKKDPNKPKGCKSAYIFFTEYRREELKRSGEEFDFGTFASQCGNLWKNMDESEKDSFEKLAHQDRIRHQREMEDYSPIENSDDSDDEGPKRKKKKKKDPNAPKRNISAYFFFAEKVRGNVKAELENKKGEPPRVTEVMTVIGEKWRSTQQQDRLEFEELAAKDKIRYQKQCSEYHQTGQFH